MNDAGNRSLKSYIVVVVILILAIVFILWMLNLVKRDMQAKPMRDNANTTEEVTTTNRDENEVSSTEPVSNFFASLMDIIDGLNFFENYDVTTYYHGVKFNFKCGAYDIETSTCLEGSGLMAIDDALYPLFTYTNQSDNFLLRGNDFYIILVDDFVYLLDNNAAVSPGSIRVFNRMGQSVATIDNAISAYKNNGVILEKLYPSIESNQLYYYACVNNSVVINSVDIGDFKRIQRIESVEGICY